MRVPRWCRSETTWITSVVLGEFLGVPFVVEEPEGDGYTLSHDGRALTLPDIFFERAKQRWLDVGTLPGVGSACWDPRRSGLEIAVATDPLPVLVGEPGFWMDDAGNGALAQDIFGAAFLMLSRYEEAASEARDEHDRFPAEESLAYRGGFLHRPIIDEYVEVLWAAMQRVWPRIQRKGRGATMDISCDVDVPYCTYVRSAHATVRKIGGDLVRRRSLSTALRSLRNTLATRRGNFQLDPNHTFDWMMSANERAGNRITFNFLVAASDPRFDGAYSIEEPRIRALIRRIADRGHRIGLHTSYGTYRSLAQLQREVHLVRGLLREAGISEAVISSRQHYLRWDASLTARYLDEAGVTHDTTLGYAARPGFRCGTCVEFPMYDVVARCPLRLRQRPLLVMEDSVFAPTYMGLPHGDAALEVMVAIRRRARAVGGSFSLVWHNSGFCDAADPGIYSAVIGTNVPLGEAAGA